ncbi:hypothetical protein ACVIDN_004997 [Rhizobium brockwellii]
MKDIDGRLDQRQQPSLHLCGCFREAHAEILLLPLTDTHNYREIRSDRFTHGADDLDCKARAFFDCWSAIPVGPQIGARPEELINQIAVRAVDLDSVETKPLGVCRGFGEGCDRIGDMLFSHRYATRLTRRVKTRRALYWGVGLPIIDIARCFSVPDLRPHRTSSTVDSVDHILPSLKCRIAMKERNSAIVAGGRAINHGLFRQYQSGATFCPAPIVVSTR